MKVLIVKGTHKGTIATVTEDKKEEIGTDRLYALNDQDGQKIWNGQFTYFPQSFVKPIGPEIITPLQIETKEYEFNVENWVDGQKTVTLKEDGTFQIYDDLYKVIRIEQVEDFGPELGTEIFVFHTVYAIEGQNQRELFTVHEMGPEDYIAEHIVSRSAKNPFIVACLVLFSIV